MPLHSYCTFTFRMTVSTYPDREFRDGGYAMRPLSVAAVSNQGMQQALQPALASPPAATPPAGSTG